MKKILVLIDFLDYLEYVFEVVVILVKRYNIEFVVLYMMGFF